VGLYAVNIGTVTAAEWLTAKPQNPIHYIYPWSGVSTINGFAALGLGVSIPIDSRIRMMLESRFSQSSSGGESFVPILATMQFDVGV
jgi:hypothetical protein